MSEELRIRGAANRESSETRVGTVHLESRDEPSRVNSTTSRARSPSEEGEEIDDNPPLPDESPPLPDEELPPNKDDGEQAADDGWEARMDANTGAWYFFNHFTGLSQWENPRVPDSNASGSDAQHGPPGVDTLTAAPTQAPPTTYFGYNPKIHGDFDPNADYAKFHDYSSVAEQGEEVKAAEALIGTYDQSATFNRFTGAFQGADKADYHNDENKSSRQMGAFFDVDRAANTHDGRSLKAERSGKKLSKKTIKEFNEKRREKKEKKRRDFLMS